jgi:histidinol phosphatase-like enzyme (inositol monophosphatase family)
MPEPDLRELLDFATDAARQAGQITLEYFQTGVEVDRKADDSPVTIADRTAEQKLEELIHSRYPEDAIIGEEFGDRPGNSGRSWIVDPIDGTKSFVHGVPLYGVMIGVEIDDESVVGVVHLPALDEMVCAAKGLGCQWNGKPAGVSNVTHLNEALLCATDFESFDENGKGDAYRNLRKEVRLARGWGDCYGHVLVATGRAEMMLDPIMNVWDCAALLPIVEEAGGVYSDWKGDRNIRGDGAISTNANLSGEVKSKLGIV